jgi:hypothetical protein
MKTKIIEATQNLENGFNWGKFLIGRLDEEWRHRSIVGSDSDRALLAQCGWGSDHLWVLDLQTGEGAYFLPGGYAVADLNKHAIWVCPMFEPFLTWLYAQDVTDLDALPAVVELPNVPGAFAGYRRTRSTS